MGEADVRPIRRSCCQYHNTKVSPVLSLFDCTHSASVRSRDRTYLYRLPNGDRRDWMLKVSFKSHFRDWIVDSCLRLHIRTFILQLQNASFTNYYLKPPRSQQNTILNHKPRLSITSTFNHLDLRPSVSVSVPYKADFLLDPTVPTPSKWIIKSLVKNSLGQVCLTCPCMYSEAIWTCSALIPGSEATFLPSSSNIGARYSGVIDLFESCLIRLYTSMQEDGRTYGGLLGVFDPLP
jgi:hypothetical protein